MELRNLTNNPTDYLDAYCEAVLGHTNWEFIDTQQGIYFSDEAHTGVVFFNNPEEEHE